MVSTGTIIHCLDKDDERWDNYRSIPLVFKNDTNYNYVLSGPTGGGKTGSAVFICSVNGAFRGKRVFSTVPFGFVVYTKNGQRFIYQAEGFDLRAFIRGDEQYWDSWVFLDEGNFNMDVKKLMSNMNIGLTDIIQEGRKMRMNVVLSAISPRWLDPRFTGSMLDVMIETRDLYHTPYGKANGMHKGVTVVWRCWDITGKYAGYQKRFIGMRHFFLRSVWGMFDTEYFINPIEARKNLRFNREVVMVGGDDKLDEEYGYTAPYAPAPPRDMESEIKQIIDSLIAEGYTEVSSSDLLETLGYHQPGIKQRAGAVLSRLGVKKRQKWSNGVRGYVYQFA